MIPIFFRIADGQGGIRGGDYVAPLPEKDDIVPAGLVGETGFLLVADVEQGCERGSYWWTVNLTREGVPPGP